MTTDRVLVHRCGAAPTPALLPSAVLAELTALLDRYPTTARGLPDRRRAGGARGHGDRGPRVGGSPW
jgi:hypothetical protein